MELEGKLYNIYLKIACALCGFWVLATFCWGTLTETQSRCYVCILMYIPGCYSSSLPKPVSWCCAFAVSPCWSLPPSWSSHVLLKKDNPSLQRLKLGQAWGLIAFIWVSEMRFGQAEDKLFWDVNTYHIRSLLTHSNSWLGVFRSYHVLLITYYCQHIVWTIALLNICFGINRHGHSSSQPLIKIKEYFFPLDCFWKERQL